MDCAGIGVSDPHQTGILIKGWRIQTTRKQVETGTLVACEPLGLKKPRPYPLLLKAAVQIPGGRKEARKLPRGQVYLPQQRPDPRRGQGLTWTPLRRET